MSISSHFLWNLYYDKGINFVVKNFSWALARCLKNSSGEFCSRNKVCRYFRVLGLLPIEISFCWGIVTDIWKLKCGQNHFSPLWYWKVGKIHQFLKAYHTKSLISRKVMIWAVWHLETPHITWPLRSFCTPCGAPRSVPNGSYVFFKGASQAPGEKLLWRVLLNR